MSDECKKFQWSKFTEDRSEQFVIRTENWQEIVDYRIKVNVLTRPVVESTVTVVNVPTQPAEPVVQATAGHTCQVHNTTMIYKEGISKVGKPYKIWSCPVKDNGVFCDQKEWVK